MVWDLSPKPRRLRTFAGNVVKISDDLRKTVVFIGTQSVPEGEFRAFGTGFLIHYEGVTYLVTAQHIAAGLGEDPFAIRVNIAYGGSKTIHVDLLESSERWRSLPDGSADLAIIAFTKQQSWWDVKFLDEDMLLRAPDAENVGVGDLCYTIGLFRLLQGKRRNLPVVHPGSVALMPSDELLPVKDWLQEDRTRHVHGYLVASHSMNGLSGAPVFVRSTTVLKDLPGGRSPVIWPELPVRLMGIWMSAWDAPPAQAIAVERGVDVRVSLGFGIVVPTFKLIELLDLPEERSRRAEARKHMSIDQLAKPD